MPEEGELLSQLVIQLRTDVTQGFARTAKATELSRVEGQLQAYQAETDRRLSALESIEHGRSGTVKRAQVIGGVIAFLVSNGALWAAVLVHR